ncbi:membrane protein [Microbacterium phage LesNorah]|nr:hypothetical protein SEA_BLUERUGRAT_38 [Microbacterium phage BlueRugrat]UQS94805.1 membrane protein [Microbacterium phage LesNorah]
MTTWQRIKSASVWNPNAYTGKERKYRSLTRVWLPVYNALLFLCGYNAARYGSQLLDRLLGDRADLYGYALCTIAVLCLVGVTFPKFEPIEVVAKCGMIGLFSGYIGLIWLEPSSAQLAFSGGPSWFIMSMIAVGLPLALFRLNVIAEKEFERRVAKRAQEIRDAE